MGGGWGACSWRVPWSGPCVGRLSGDLPPDPTPRPAPPCTRLTGSLSEATKRMAARRILSRVSEAYGRMLLLDGLFQADGHPGNILVMKGGKIGLIDYGQSKQLPDSYRAAFAQLVLALARRDEQAISTALRGVGVVTDRDAPGDAPLRTKLAVGMFDTRGK